MSIDYGRNWQPGMEWIIIDREAVLGFDDEPAKSSFYKMFKRTVQSVKNSLQLNDEKTWGKHTASDLNQGESDYCDFGDELDFLAIGPNKQLVCIELKHGSYTSGIYAFLIEAEGKKVFYSGDFRAHGRKSILFDSFVNQPPRGIDMLLMEGTMLQRDNSDFPTEESVETTIATVLSAQDNISFLISLSQNIDRIVSAFRACKRTGKILVIDLYTAWVLEQMRQVTNNVPTIDWEHIKVAFDKTRANVLMGRDNRAMFGSFVDRAIRNRVTGSELTGNPHKYLMLLNISSGRLIKKFALQEKPVTVIYSQWQGYLNQVEGAVGNNKAAADMREMKAAMIPGVTFLYAHTSGHATVADLQHFAAALKPNKLVPIHTEYGSLYKDHFENVLEIADGETVEVQ